MKDFVRGGGRAVGFVSTHLFSLALSGLNWEAADRGQRLTLGRLSFDSRSRRCEADSVSFRQVAVGGRPYRFIADRCYFKSADLIEALSSKRFVLDTIVCVNPVLEEPMGVGAPVAVGVGAGRGGAGDTAASSVSVFVKYVAVIDGQVRLGGNKGVAASSLSTRRANCRIYGLSIDGSRKFPINTDSVRFSLDQLVFRTKDGRYALAVAGLGLEGGDAVFHGVSFGPVKENGESSTVFTAPELRLRNIAIDRLLEGRLHADGAVLSSPRVVMKKLDGMNKQAGPGMALVYRTMHDLREIVDAGALDISDGEIRYCRSGAVPVDAIASGFSAHILLNAVLGSDDLLDIKRAIPAAELGRLHATAGGQELEIRRYKFWGMRRHSEDKEVRVVLGNGSSVALRRVEWGSLDWDGFQRSGVIRVDTLHIGGVDLRQRVGAAGGVGTPGVGIPQLEIGALAVDSLFFSRGDEKQEVRFRVAGLAVTGMRTMDNLFCWEQASASIDSLHWRKDNARVSAAKMWLDSRTGVRVYGVEAQLMAGKGRVDVSAPQADIDVSFLAAAVPDRAVLRVPQATVTYERDSLAAGAVVEVSAGVIPGKSMRLYSLECSWKEAWARLKGVTREIEVDGAAGRLHTDSIHKDWRDWLDFTSLGKARVRCKMPQWSVDVGDVAWDPAERELRMSRLDVRPLLSRDSVFRRSAWQGDYLAGSAAALVLHGVMLKGEAKKPSVEIRRVRVEGASLDASRDKNMPFHHGIQKPMPTRLLASIPADVRIHQLFIDDSKVSYHERSAVTGRWGRVILGQLNAVVGPLVSRSGKGDTLAVDASAVLFDGHVRRFHYRESYADPNSGFEARVSFSPLDLTRLSDMSAPAGAVMITGGMSIRPGRSGAATGMRLTG
ncbi:hypothetical protein ACQ86N_29435 [Puia sp. P3]|uniref:hypothetical protein n=1 Tax=Puia sp. P3 TaxID=3423952 RepID=UPI003D6708B7